MEFRYYQKEAIDKVTSSYKNKKMSANIIMAQGTGKTLVALGVLSEISQMENLSSIAYVSSHKDLLSQFKVFFEERSDLDSDILTTFTYKELIDDLSSGVIKNDSIQLVIFDEVARNIKSFSRLSRLIPSFKMGISSVRVNPENSECHHINENVVYTYNLEQSIEDGFIIEYDTTYLKSIVSTIRNKSELLDPVSKASIDDELDRLEGEREVINEILDIVREGKLSKSDIAEMSYRKSQLLEFKKLLDDDVYFESKALELNGEEAVWQKYFESNQWIFGFGLSYLFNSPLEGKKLEQTVEGFSVKGNGKRIDALLKTNGLIQSLCFSEIKTHRKNILKNVKNAYRSDSWSISDELAGGIAQVQRTIQQSINNIRTELLVKTEDGFDTNQKIYQYKPASFLVIGSLNEFKNDTGYIHESKYSSFELFRRSVSDIEIITFDELYERANALVNMRWGPLAS